MVSQDKVRAGVTAQEVQGGPLPGGGNSPGRGGGDEADQRQGASGGRHGEPPPQEDGRGVHRGRGIGHQVK